MIKTDGFYFKKSKNNINNINSFHRLSDLEIVKKISKGKILNNIVKKLINSKTTYMASELFAKPAKNGLASPMHQDNYYWCIKGGNALTVWLALDNVSSKNGGIKYLNKTHKLGVVEHVPSYAKGSSQKVSNLKKYLKFKKVVPKLRPGDALFHHSQIIHGSSDNKSGKRRRALTFQFKDRSSKFDSEMKKKYLKSLKYQLKNRKRQIN
jgi:phytanoyl-CoA hydroxylase